MYTPQLNTDYRDYYDKAFKSFVFEQQLTVSRYKETQPSRIEQLEFLERIGLTTPDYGRVEDLVPRLLKRDSVVSALAGLDELFEVIVFLENIKRRLTYKDALSLYPKCFAMEYVPTAPSGNGISFEYVCVGDRPFWIEHSSVNHWQSKRGTTRSRFFSFNSNTTRTKGKALDLSSPVFSVSLLRLRNKFYAFKYNSAPFIKGTIIEPVLPGKLAADAILRWVKH